MATTIWSTTMVKIAINGSNISVGKQQPREVGGDRDTLAVRNSNLDGPRLWRFLGSDVGESGNPIIVMTLVDSLTRCGDIPGGWPPILGDSSTYELRYETIRGYERLATTGAIKQTSDGSLFIEDNDVVTAITGQMVAEFTEPDLSPIWQSPSFAAQLGSDISYQVLA